MTNFHNRYKESPLKRTTLISDVSTSRSTIDEIISSNVHIVGLDLEGINLGIDGQISIVSLSIPNGSIYIFDVYSCPRIMYDGKLKDLLESDSIRKVVHGAYGDAGALLSNFDVYLKNVYDTQSAYTALQLSEPRFLGQDLIPKVIGLFDLLHFYKISTNGNKTIDKSDYSQNPQLWKTRPLTEDMTLYATRDVDGLITLYHRISKERVLKDNRLLLDNLIYETVFNHVVPLTIRKRRSARKNFLRRWRSDVQNSRRLFPYYEAEYINTNEYIWKNDYNANLANPKLNSNAGNRMPFRNSSEKEKDSNDEKIEVIDTKFYQSFNKKFYFDIKQSRTAKFVKISEVNMDNTRNQIHITMCVIGRLRDHLQTLQDVHHSTPRHRYKETQTLKSEVLIKDTRRYFIDLKENGRGRFVTISQLLPVGGKLSSIAFPVQDLKVLIELIDDIQNEHSDPDEVDPLPEGNYMRANNKRFFFNISKNNKGTFMRISEVVPPSYRASITIPERSWDRFIEIFHQTCDLYKSAESASQGDATSSAED